MIPKYETARGLFTLSNIRRKVNGLRDFVPPGECRVYNSDGKLIRVEPPYLPIKKERKNGV